MPNFTTETTATIRHRHGGLRVLHLEEATHQWTRDELGHVRRATSLVTLRTLVLREPQGRVWSEATQLLDEAGYRAAAWHRYYGVFRTRLLAKN
ncbi:hypothetical protein [Streptomyces alboflavus]|uniref:hypothetical protein n=1 Tax=Streptomyces alboflavus TaxID=67267 RepID=UPI0036A0AD6B